MYMFPLLGTLVGKAHSYYIHVHCEGRKKEASKVKQTNKAKYMFPLLEH